MQKELTVMRVLRLPPLGKLVVEVNNQRYDQLKEIKEPHVQRLLQAAIGELIVFAGGYQELVNAGVAPAVSPGSGAKAPASEDARQRQEQFLAQLQLEKEKQKTLKASTSSPSSSSLVEQIDAILQRHLAAHPDLFRRSIHLTQAPAGGIQIEVDGTIYQRPREIEDKEIQLLIKQALKEWESS